MAIACTVDLLKRDAELKLLLGCTEDEMRLVNEFLNLTKTLRCVLNWNSRPKLVPTIGFRARVVGRGNLINTCQKRPSRRPAFRRRRGRPRQLHPRQGCKHPSRWRYDGVNRTG